VNDECGMTNVEWGAAKGIRNALFQHSTTPSPLPLRSTDVRAIRVRRHQRVEFGGVRELDLEKPAVEVGIGVHGGGIVRERGVHFGDLTGDGRVDVARRL